MLVVSIPKSASTFLLKTLSTLHHKKGYQNNYNNNVFPDSYQLLGKYHIDLMEYDLSDMAIFHDTTKIYKLHIPPIDNSLELLRDKMKVILLEEPQEIVMAYYLANKWLLNERREEFKNAHTSEEWVWNAKEIGLLQELKNFFDR